MRFSIIVVCLNPGEKLKETVDSILSQDCADYEIIIKDGGSRDGSVDALQADATYGSDARIRFFNQKDTGIYDAMNQAVSYATGDFVLFLNCGDLFYDSRVLSKTAEYMDRESAMQEDGTVPADKKSLANMVFYGNTYSGKNQVLITSPAKINTLSCYRNIPCHQSCFYATRLCKEKPYDLQYSIRADYDHFLWCYYRSKAKMVAMDVTASMYEGGGFSENPSRRKKDLQEQESIIREYMSRKELLLCRLWKWGTLTPVRRRIAESRNFSKKYHKLREKL
ncbi:MAG: glycosyltransferase [Lachnospiraceae bacterium]|nr:glycosyltransferase [Lachnospiraceae bacterium]